MHEAVGVKIWPVGSLVAAVGGALAEQFNPLRVKGEVSGFSQATSGHCYFTLKDGQGQIRCAMFKRAASLLARLPKNGDVVEVMGKLDVYPPRGDLQLIVESLRVGGQGSLFERFLALKDKLQQQGLFDASRKRDLPLYPRHIAVVTSLGAAALHDVVTALARRVPHVMVSVYPSAVQGQGAAAELTRALQQAGRGHREGVPCDVILLVRGGGSLEDLWSFNDEHLALQIAASSVPVVSGVGHETDFTIADFVADLRAPTPTAAAEQVAQSTAHLSAALAGWGVALERAVTQTLDREAQRCDRLTARLARPSQGVDAQRQRLYRRVRHIMQLVRGRVDGALASWTAQQASYARLVSADMAKRQAALAQLQIRLESASPKKALERGYAWVQTADGAPLGSVAQVRVGQPLRVMVKDGQLHATVSAIEPE